MTAASFASVREIRPDGPALDLGMTAALVRAAEQEIRTGARGLVIDLARIEHLDGQGVAALVLLRHRLPQSVPVALAGLGPAAQTIARVSLLHESFDLYADATSAAVDLAEMSEPASTAHAQVAPPRKGA